MKKVSALLVVMIAVVFSAAAQNLTKLGVSEVRLQSFGEIIEAEQVKGYYYFYQLERAGKNNIYQLVILDENLREVNSKELIRPQSYQLIAGAFNGEAFGFLFYNAIKPVTGLVSYSAKRNAVEFITLDKTLKETGSVIQNIPDRGYSRVIYTNFTNGLEPEYTLLAAVPKQGFILYTYPDENEYEVEFYDNSAKKIWSQRAPEDKMDVELADEAFQSEKYVGSLIERRKGILSHDADYTLLVQDVQTGKQLLNKPIEDDKFNLMASNIFYEEDSKTITVFGEFFELGDKQYKSQGLGFFCKVLDMEGNVIRDKYITWNGDIAKVVPVDAKGRMDGKKRVLIHEVIKTADGEIFIIGEQYRRTSSMAGFASTALSGSKNGMTLTQLEMSDMVIFHFGKDLSAKDVQFFAKDKTVIAVPSGNDFTSSRKLAFMAKAYGLFDYKFSQIAKDKNTFISTYIDYDREKGEKAKNMFGAIAYTPEKTFTVDKIALNRKSTDYFVRKAKPGYVMVTEYFRKDKKLDIRLEKINF